MSKEREGQKLRFRLNVTNRELLLRVDATQGWLQLEGAAMMQEKNKKMK